MPIDVGRVDDRRCGSVAPVGMRGERRLDGAPSARRARSATSRCRAAATAPSTIADGAWSPPIASTAMRIISQASRARYSSSTGRTCRACSSRSAGRCGAAPSARGTAGTSPVVAAVSASCVRRLAVRVFECRRFGFGMSLVMSPVFCKPLERRQPRILPPAARTRTCRCSGSCRTAGTARGSPPGTAASSAAPGRTARAAARSGRSGRPGSSWSRGRLPATSRSSSAASSDAGRYRRSNGASTGMRNGSRQRLHVSSSSVRAVPTSRNRSLSLWMSKSSSTGATIRYASPSCATSAGWNVSGEVAQRLPVPGEVELHDVPLPPRREIPAKGRPVNYS